MTPLIKVEMKAILKKVHRLNKSNAEQILIKSLNSGQYIFIKKSLQELNDLYQRNDFQ